MEVLETTFNNATFASYPESADVYVRMFEWSDWYLIGEVRTNEFAELDISNASDFLPFITQVKVVDTTPGTSQSPDAFDLDGIVALSGCTTLTDEEVAAFSALLSTDEVLAATNDMLVYPVPAKNSLNVKLTGQNGAKFLTKLSLF